MAVKSTHIFNLCMFFYNLFAIGFLPNRIKSHLLVGSKKKVVK